MVKLRSDDTNTTETTDNLSDEDESPEKEVEDQTDVEKLPIPKNPSRLTGFSHKIFFLCEDLCKTGEDLELIHLRNPCTGKPARYICLHDQKVYYEILKFNEPNRSWFIGDILSVDGSIYMTTIIDPIFLVLYYLQEHCSQLYVPLDHALKDETFPEISHFTEHLSMKQLLMVADQKGSDDLKALKFNEEKTLKWLSFKCTQIKNHLAANKFFVDAGAKSATFVKSEKLQTDPDDAGLMAYAAGILREYISKELGEKLLVHLGLETVKPKSNKRKSSNEVPTSKSSKKIKAVDENSEETSIKEPPTPSPKALEKKVTAKAKAMAKAASGSKSIMSFFTKK